MQHYTYILKCADSTLYTGYTNNLEARINAHNSGNGAKYTKPRLPVTLLYSECFKTKSEAMKREYEIKQYTREQKMVLIHFEQTAYLPKGKHDIASIKKLETLSNFEIQQIAFELLTWVQDMNWPIASEMVAFIISRQTVFIPQIKKVLHIDATDTMWKYWIITQIIPFFTEDNLILLNKELKRLVKHPSTQEIDDEVYKAICNFLEK